MSFKFFRIILALTFCIGLLKPAYAQNEFNKRKADSLLEMLTVHDKMMGSVAISHNGEIIYQKAFGYAAISEKKRQPAKINTKYRIGSISKTFTAVMIYQLIEEGKLSLDTKLNKFFPKLPNADKITVNQMLRHRSGLFNYVSGANLYDMLAQPTSKKALLELFESQQASFAPGESAAYSNTNYALLTFIIEELDNKDFSKALQDRIVSKLNLDNTYYCDGMNIEDNEALSFTFDGKQWIEHPKADVSWLVGAGGLVSTPTDMLTFIEALFTNKLLNQESLESMKTIREGYGAGLLPYPFYEKTAYGHSGGIEAYRSDVAYFPKEKVAIATTFNGLNYSKNNINIGLLSILFDKPYTLPEFDTTTVTIEKPEAFVGEYTSAQLPLKIAIREQDNQLKLQASGQPEFTMQPRQPTKFTIDQVGAKLVFDQLEEGNYQQFVLEQNGMKIIFNRKTETSTVAIENPKAFIGVYASDQLRMKITVRKKGNQLKMQASGQPELAMRPHTATEFIIDQAAAKLIFSQEQEGKYQQFVLEQNGMKVPFKRENTGAAKAQ